MRVGVRFYAGGRADEVPRALVIGREEEPVEVLGSWNEELRGAEGVPGVRRRRFRVRTPDGSILVLEGDGSADAWQIHLEAPAVRSGYP